MRHIVTSLLSGLVLCGITSCGHRNLASDIHEILTGYDACVGVAVIIDDSDTVTVNDSCRYPLMSVFKFHQALAVCHELSQNGISLDSMIHVVPSDLRANTYSPLRDNAETYDFDISIASLLQYTLQLSDNNACDILFDRVVGVRETDAFIRSLGVTGFAISANEDDMHVDQARCYDNWSSPLAVCELVNKFRAGDVLSGDYQHFVYRTLTECKTGVNRLAAPLGPGGVVLGHKTGTSDLDSHGRIIAVNDVGFVELPDGRHYSIAVLVRQSSESMERTERIIAEVSATVYDYMTKK